MPEPTVLFDRLPAAGPFTGTFGQWYFDGERTWQHRGVDIGCPTGTPVYAPAPGIVAPFTNDGSFGIAVCLNHGGGWWSLYAHLSRAIVSPGNGVQRGALLGLSGATGYVAGAHLHWQLCDSPSFPVALARSRDPLKYLISEETMESYRWGLTNLLERPWWEIVAIYDKLRAAGLFAAVEAAEGVPGPVDGNGDTNDIMLRVRRIQGLAGGPRALEAAKLLGVA